MTFYHVSETDSFLNINFSFHQFTRNEFFILKAKKNAYTSHRKYYCYLYQIKWYTRAFPDKEKNILQNYSPEFIYLLKVFIFFFNSSLLHHLSLPIAFQLNAHSIVFNKSRSVLLNYLQSMFIKQQAQEIWQNF